MFCLDWGGHRFIFAGNLINNISHSWQQTNTNNHLNLTLAAFTGWNFKGIALCAFQTLRWKHQPIAILLCQNFKNGAFFSLCHSKGGKGKGSIRTPLKQDYQISCAVAYSLQTSWFSLFSLKFFLNLFESPIPHFFFDRHLHFVIVNPWILRQILFEIFQKTPLLESTNLWSHIPPKNIDFPPLVSHLNSNHVESQRGKKIKRLRWLKIERRPMEMSGRWQ